MYSTVQVGASVLGRQSCFIVAIHQNHESKKVVAQLNSKFMRQVSLSSNFVMSST